MALSDGGKEMTFWDHLDELRGTIIRSVAAICIFAVAGLAFKNLLFSIVLAPSRPDFCIYRLLGWDFGMTLINVEVSAQFFVHLRAAAIAGVVIAFPYIIYQLWKFIAPALYKNEIAPVRKAFLMSSGLFYLGVLVGYFFVLPVCLQFFMNYTVSDMVTNSITISSYMSLFTSMVLMIGLVFEFPTVVILLARIGIIGRKTLRKGRKYALIVIMVLSAIITPSDPFSMLVLTIPLYGLYELSILCCPTDKKEETDE